MNHGRCSYNNNAVIRSDCHSRIYGQAIGTAPRFAVCGNRENDTVILKMTSAPDMSQFDDLISCTRTQARKAGLKSPDISSATQIYSSWVSSSQDRSMRFSRFGAIVRSNYIFLRKFFRNISELQRNCQSNFRESVFRAFLICS